MAWGRKLKPGWYKKKIKANPEISVTYHKITCPKCGSENQRVYKTDKPIRYHKCDDCNYNFKSIESE